MEKIKILLPIIVEGKYDKIKISSVADACILTTDGFGVFKSSEKLAILKKLAEKSKVIVMTDSDGAGKLIRSHIASAIPKDRLIQLYIPQVEGKERRKAMPSAEGYLGVEGTDADIIRKLLEPFSSESGGETLRREEITKLDFFEVGLTGKPSSSERRDKLAKSVGLPDKMTSNALLAALNVLMDKEKFMELVKQQLE